MVSLRIRHWCQSIWRVVLALNKLCVIQEIHLMEKNMEVIDVSRNPNVDLRPELSEIYFNG